MIGEQQETGLRPPLPGLTSQQTDRIFSPVPDLQPKQEGESVQGVPELRSQERSYLSPADEDRFQAWAKKKEIYPDAMFRNHWRRIQGIATHYTPSVEALLDYDPSVSDYPALLKAGFTHKEIREYLGPIFAAAGFTDAQIHEHFTEQTVPGVLKSLDQGWQGSWSGMVLSGKLPDDMQDEEIQAMGMLQHLAAGFTGFGGGIPPMLAGGIIGAGMSGFNPLATGAAMFAAYEGMTDAKRAELEKKSLKDQLRAGASGTAMGAVTGMGVAGAGIWARTLTAGMPKVVQAGSAIGSEAFVLDQFSSGFQGEYPSTQGFANAALFIAAMHGAGAVTGAGMRAATMAARDIEPKARKAFDDFNIHPNDLAEISQKDPTVRQDLLSINKDIPDALIREPATEYNLDSKLDRLREELDESTAGHILTAQRTELDWALDTASQVSLPEIENRREAILTALAHGRDDIVRAILARSRRYAERFSTTPGVSKDSPKYEGIKADLEAMKSKAEREAIELENFARLNESERASGQRSPVEPTAEPVATEQRTAARRELAQPYIDRMVEAGYTPEDAQTLIQPYLANAETMAPLFGQTPKEYIESRLARDLALTPEEFAGQPGSGKWFQPSLDEIRAGDEALKRDSEAWGNSVDSFINGTLPARQSVAMLNQTPLVLQMLGAKDLPVNTTYGILKKVLVEKHKLPPETVKQVPAAMADPVMVFKSATQAGDLVMMLELKDQHGATVVVPIALEASTPEGYIVNLATSVYGRQRVGTTTPNNQWFLNQIQDGNLLYQNKQKSRSWAAMVGLSLPPTHRSGSARNTVHTEADLVKLREANPTLYQSAPPTGTPAFKNWFGDSKIVDPKTGEPLAVRHATDADIEAFDSSFAGENTLANASDPYIAATSATGFWFIDKDIRGRTGAKKSVEAYLSLENPKRFGSLKELAEHIKENANIEDADGNIDPVASGKGYQDILKSQGYDGIILKDEEFGGTSYVAFSPEQVKSTNNRGTYDPNDPRIFYQSARSTPRANESSDARYFAAVEAGDMATAQRIVDQRAAQQGYISAADYRMNHQAPSSHDADVSVNLTNLKESSLVPSDYWTNPRWYQNDPDEFSSFYRIAKALENGEKYKSGEWKREPGVTMYRAIPKNVKENQFRNGDWITPSLEYARNEGAMIPGGYRIIKQHVKLSEAWWDGNSINEFGFDDGKSYAYKDTKNNRKLTDTVVRDYDGNIVPPSKRFNPRAYEPFYQYAGERSSMSEPVRTNLVEAQRLAEAGTENESIRQQTGWFKGMDGKWRYEIPDNIDSVNLSNIPHSMGGGSRVPLSKVYNNPRLFEAYPWLRDVNIEVTQDALYDYDPGRAHNTQPPSAAGYWNADTKTIVLNYASTESLKRHNPGVYGTVEQTIIHEIQHAIQQAEGFARGGNPNEFASGPMFSQKARDLASDLSTTLSGSVTMRPLEIRDALGIASEKQAAMMEAIAKDQGFSSLNDAMGFLLAEDHKRTPYGQYERLAGEREARDAANRSTFSAEERAAIKPDLRDDAIVLFGDKQVATMSAEIFQEGSEGPRGGIRRLDDGRFIIGLFQNKNLSTMLHEGGHFFLENLREASRLDTAPEWVRESWKTVQEEYGFTGDAIPKKAHEQFARDFEAYLREGKAPTPRLESAFAKFKEWLTEIYKSVQDILGDRQLSPEIREVFDRLLAGEEARAREARGGQANDAVITYESIDKGNGTFTVTPELEQRLSLVERRMSEGEGGERFQKDDGTWDGVQSTNPEWLKADIVTTEVVDGKTKTVKRPGILKEAGKAGISRVIAKVREGKPLTPKQREVWRKTLEAADHEWNNDPATVQARELEALANQGFEITEPRQVPAGNIAEGEQVVVAGRDGMPDVVTHKGYDAEGRAILQDGVTIHADPWDMINTIGRESTDGGATKAKPSDLVDWSVAQPEAHEPLPPIRDTGGILAESGIDPHTGISLDEAALAHLDAQGMLASADKETLLAHAAEGERINTLEEHALSIAECVMQVGI